jgi:hypothetical protein
MEARLFFSILAAPALVTIGAVSCARALDVRSPVDRIVVSRCGACHPSPEPGRLECARYAEALERHRKRVPMSDAERKAIVDHLCGGQGPGPAGARINPTGVPRQRG